MFNNVLDLWNKSIKNIIMSEFKGTKGEWDYVKGMIEGNMQSHFFIISNKSQYNICKCQSATMNLTESEANAKLIACAPEMLEALESLLHANSINKIENMNFESIRQLIKKATE